MISHNNVPEIKVVIIPHLWRECQIFHCKLNIRKEIDQMHFSQRFWIEFDIMILVNYHFAELKFRLKLFYNYTCTVEFWFWANFCESSMQLWIGWFECLSSVDDVWNYVSLMPCCLWWLKVSILNACFVIWIEICLLLKRIMIEHQVIFIIVISTS